MIWDGIGTDILTNGIEKKKFILIFQIKFDSKLSLYAVLRIFRLKILLIKKYCKYLLKHV
jgi:hypothetical protein